MKWSNKGCIGGFLITVFFSIIIPAYTNFSPVELFRKLDPIAQDIITINVYFANFMGYLTNDKKII